jgi:hypothetical protein
MSNTPNNAELPPRDLEMEARSMEAYRNGNYATIQARIDELYLEILQVHCAKLPLEFQEQMRIAIQESIVKPLLNKAAELRQDIVELAMYKEAIEILEKGPILAISVLDHGGYHITVKSGTASISADYNVSLIDAILIAGKAYAQ